MMRPARRRTSRELRKRRLGRAVVGGLFGLVWSTGLMALLSQLGRVDQSRLPWWGGIALGVGLSASLTLARCSLRRLRVEVVRARAPAMVALVAAGAAVVLAAGAGPAAAQGGSGRCEVEAVVTSADGTRRTVQLSTTSRDDPLVLDSSVARIDVVLDTPQGVTLGGRTFEVRSEIAGIEHRLSRSEPLDDGSRGVAFKDVSALVRTPGLFRLWGRVDGVCDTREAWVRIEGPLLGNWPGRVAVLALAAGGGGLTAFLFRTRFDYWTFTTADGVTLSLLDQHTGRLIRGPLVRGATYTAELALTLPDPASHYAALPGPVQAVVGLVGVGAQPEAATFDLRSRRPRVRRPVQVPADLDATIHVVADVHVAGNTVQSLALIEHGTGYSRLDGSIRRGIGSVSYRAASLAAGELADLAPVDAMVTVHGDAGREVMETWTLLPSNRVLNRHTVRRAELENAAAVYRDRLNRLFLDWADAAPGDDDDLIALAWAGAELRRTVVGDPTLAAPVDGRVVVAHDPQALGAMTFPWSGLYDGPVSVGGPARICSSYVDDPRSCEAHDDTVVCPGRFWGVRYELAWPDGWVPARTISRLGRWWRLATSLAGRPRLLRLPNRLANRAPVGILSVTAPELVHGRLDDLDGLRAVARTWPASTLPELRAALADHGAEVDIVHILAHGTTNAGVGRSRVTVNGWSIELDQPLGPSQLADLAPAGVLRQGPLVVLNACRSGVIGAADDHHLVDALRRLGARGVVVTEIEIDDRTAVATAAELLGDLLTGIPVPAALLDTRRRELACDRRLTSLAYTYYGPSRLHLVNPVRRVNQWRRQPCTT